jgi:hypothetical protein
MNRRESKKRTWYSRILLACAIIAVIYFIWRNTGQILRYDFQFRWSYLIASFFAAITTFLLNFYIWAKLAESFSLKADTIKSGKAWFLSQLGKYVPGKVGLLLVRLNAYKGYSKKKIAVATGIEYIASFASACILILVAIASAPQLIPSFVRWFAVFGLLFLLIFLYPTLLMRIVNWGFKLIKRSPIEEMPSYREILRFVCAYTCSGLIGGFSAFLLFNSFAPLHINHFLTLTGTFYAAGLVGIAAVFAPSGIGVREGVLCLILPAFIPKPTVIVGAIAMRLITTVAELILAGIFVLADRIWGREKQ